MDVFYFKRKVEVSTAISGHSTVISGVAAYKDEYIASAGYDGNVILWNAKTKKTIAQGRHDHLANQVCFSPDGKLLLSTSSDYTARLWRVPSMQLCAVLNGHNDDIESASFSPDGSKIATASFDDTIGIYDCRGNRLKTLAGHSSDVNMVFWTDSERVISTGDDGTIRLWNIETEKNTILDKSDVEVDTAILGSDGIIFSADDNGYITAFDVFQERVVFKIKAHDSAVKRLMWSSETCEILSASYDGNLSIWSYLDNKICKISTYLLPKLVWARSMATIGRDKIVFATFGSCYAILDKVSGEWDLTGVNLSISLNSTCSDHDGSLYFIGDGGLLYNEYFDETSKIGELCTSLLLMGNKIIALGQSGNIFNARTGSEIYKHTSPIVSAISLSENILLVGTYDGELLLLNYDETIKALSINKKSKVAENSIKCLAIIGCIIGCAVSTGNVVFVNLNTLEVVSSCFGHSEVGDLTAS